MRHVIFLILNGASAGKDPTGCCNCIKTDP